MTVAGRALPQGEPGDGIVRGSIVGTALFVVAAVLAALFPDSLRIPYAVLAIALFAIGCVTFLWAYFIAVERSRLELIDTFGLYFLSNVAPTRTRRWLMAALVIQVVVAIAAAAVRPYSAVAFGILVPVFGLGLSGLWGARHGTFPERTELNRKRPRTSSGRSNDEDARG